MKQRKNQVICILCLCILLAGFIPAGDLSCANKHEASSGQESNIISVRNYTGLEDAVIEKTVPLRTPDAIRTSRKRNGGNSRNIITRLILTGIILSITIYTLAYRISYLKWAELYIKRSIFIITFIHDKDGRKPIYLL